MEEDVKEMKKDEVGERLRNVQKDEERWKEMCREMKKDQKRRGSDRKHAR